jgi:hypothetical protein
MLLLIGRTTHLGELLEVAQSQSAPQLRLGVLAAALLQRRLRIQQRIRGPPGDRDQNVRYSKHARYNVRYNVLQRACQQARAWYYVAMQLRTARCRGMQGPSQEGLGRTCRHAMRWHKAKDRLT